jgi:hypothetical protein
MILYTIDYTQSLRQEAIGIRDTPPSKPLTEEKRMGLRAIQNALAEEI